MAVVCRWQGLAVGAAVVVGENRLVSLPEKRSRSRMPFSRPVLLEWGVTGLPDLIAVRASREKRKADEKLRREKEEAKNRQAWRQSSEAAKARRRQYVIYGFIPVWVTVGGIAGNAFFSINNPLLSHTINIKSLAYIKSLKEGYIVNGCLAGLIFGLYVSILLGFAVRAQARKEFSDRVLLGEAEQALKETEEEISGDAQKDLIMLWSATQKRLDIYHKIATSQSERSFLYAQAAAGMGFLVLVVAALIAGISRSTAASIVAGVAGISGGSLAAYIGATFMKSQEMASTQLRAYFNQPLEFSRYLEAERLMNLIDQKDRTETVRSIIRSITKAPDNQ